MSITKMFFRDISNGIQFQATNGDTLIKRAGLADRLTFCHEESKTVRLNAIVPGITMADADTTQFVHFCPLDYVRIKSR